MTSKPKKTATNAGGTATQIGTLPGRMHEFLGCSISELRYVLKRFSAFRWRDSMHKEFGVNKSEMWALFCLDGYLESQDRILVSQQMFIDSLSGTPQTKRRILGFVSGLSRLGCIGSFEYTNNPGSLSIGITDFGFKVLDAYYKQMDDLFVKYNRKELHIDRFSRSINQAENIPTRYISLMSA